MNLKSNDKKVFVHPIKKSGYITKTLGDNVEVEYVSNFNRETNEKTLKREVFKASEVSKYREKRPEGNVKKYNPNERYYMVREFHKAFGHPYTDVPQKLDAETVKDRYKWMLEELNEFLEAETIYDQVDALIDLMYFAEGTFTQLGVRPHNAFKIVHQANMNKLDENGRPIYKEDGKIAKPKSWSPPEPLIKEDIERQLQAAQRKLNKQ